MEDKENKPRQLSCLSKGPGPAYLLPTLIGYNRHDPSRYRNPAYSMRERIGKELYGVGPGPCYKIDQQTRYGIKKAPAYTIGSKGSSKFRESGPGPGAYSPEKCPPVNHSLRTAAYTIKSRNEERFCDDGPGPNVYLLPTCIGPKVPDKTALGAFTIASRRGGKDYDVGPGPAAYGNLNVDFVKRRLPAYSVGSRLKGFENVSGPGPRYYPRLITGKRAPMYSFGVRHSECAAPVITECDDE